MPRTHRRVAAATTGTGPTITVMFWTPTRRRLS